MSSANLINQVRREAFARFADDKLRATGNSGDRVSHHRAKACYLCRNLPCDGHLHGLDRVDNAKGYELDNVQPCCFSCNFMKNDWNGHIVLKQCLHRLGKLTLDQHITLEKIGEGDPAAGRQLLTECLAELELVRSRLG